MLTHQQQRVVLAAVGLLMLGCAVKAWHPRVPSIPLHPGTETQQTTHPPSSPAPSTQGDLPTHSTPDQ